MLLCHLYVICKFICTIASYSVFTLMFTAADPGFIKGDAPVYGVGICAPQKLKLFAGQNILNGLDHSAFYVDYIDQELYRVTIMPADYYYYRHKE